MAEHIDLDVSGILRRELTWTRRAMRSSTWSSTANGRLTAAETLGHREFSLTKLWRLVSSGIRGSGIRDPLSS